MSDYQPLVDRYRNRVNAYKQAGLKVFASSSFQTHSIPMLHILSTIDRSIPIYFMNTGFHFTETISYKNQIARLIQMQVISLESPMPKSSQRTVTGNLVFTEDPDYCCYLNKILPLEPVLSQYDVWITGVRRDQNQNRSRFKEEETGKFGIKRYHPMLGWNNKLIFQYIQDNHLPRHPLEDSGYVSIGCEPCTIRITASMMDDERNGRWFGLNKTECGLHTEIDDEN
jgi:phosphoadenosine phosphosulfate reductase